MGQAYWRFSAMAHFGRLSNMLLLHPLRVYHGVVSLVCQFLPTPPSFLLDMHVREIVVVVGWWVALAIGKNPTRCQSGGRVCKGSQL